MYEEEKKKVEADLKESEDEMEGEEGEEEEEAEAEDAEYGDEEEEEDKVRKTQTSNFGTLPLEARKHFESSVCFRYGYGSVLWFRLKGVNLEGAFFKRMCIKHISILCQLGNYIHGVLPVIYLVGRSTCKFLSGTVIAS